MALTDDVVLRFDGPSVWGRTDCVAWLEACTGLPLTMTTVWYRECRSEAHAVARAKRLHGSLEAAALAELRAHGYGTMPEGTMLEPEDIAFVADRVWGVMPAGVGAGPTLLLRHQFGVARASGPIVRHIRRT